MNSPQILTAGNLALKQAPTKPRFKVIDGTRMPAPAAGTVPSTTGQLRRGNVFDLPDALPRTSALKSSPTRLRSALLIACIAFVLCFSTLQFFSVNPAVDVAPFEFDKKEISILPGDSLWSIANDNRIDGLTTNEQIQLIKDWNALDNGTLQPGWTLTVPVK